MLQKYVDVCKKHSGPLQVRVETFGRDPYLILFLIATGRYGFGVVSACLRPLLRSFLAASSRRHEPRRDYHLRSTVRDSGQPPDHSRNCTDT